MRPKLDRHPVGKRRLSRRRRACDQDKLFIFLRGNLFCDFADPLFHLRFLEQNNILHFPLDNLFIQLPDGTDLHLLCPCRSLHQCMVQLLRRLKHRRLFRIFIRKHQHKAILIQKQVKIFQISGRRHHIPVKIILKSVHIINIHMRAPAELEQLCLVLHPAFHKSGNRKVCMDRIFADLNIRLHKFLHLRANLIQQLLAYRTALQLTILPLPERMHHAQLDASPVQIINRLFQQHNHASAVRFSPFCICRR